MRNRLLSILIGICVLLISPKFNFAKRHPFQYQDATAEEEGEFDEEEEGEEA